MNDEKSDYARTEVYLAPPAVEPKHMFVCVADIVAERHRCGFRLLDVGAASGAFLAYALTRFPGTQAVGVDFDPALVAEAVRRVPGATFRVGDANHLADLPSGSFDAVTMTGTHSIFPDFKSSFGECIRCAAPSGRIVVTGIFNQFPVDAQIHWRYPDRDQDGWHPGYNLFSHQSISAFLRRQPRVKGFEFRPFTIPFDIAPREDPIRSWTEPAPDGQRMFRNGIMPLNFEMLIIDLHPQ